MMATSFSYTSQEDQNFETYSLIWLDAAVNNSPENIQAQQQLRTSINHLVTFEDEQRCYHYIRSVPKDDRVVLIVSGHLGQIIVPKIVSLRQLTSIYIYCKNKNENEKWASQFSKIKAVVIKLDDLIQRIYLEQHQHKQNQIDESLPMCIIRAGDNEKQRSVSDLNGDFLHSQILIDCLMKLKYNVNEKIELMTVCKQQYKGNSKELKKIIQFERDYLSDNSIWWYTRNSFVYKMINKALRVQNIHLIFLFRFFIRHVEKRLTQIKCTTPIRVYRAQLMTNDEVEMMKNSAGQYISINSFFSTSVDYNKARSFFIKGDKLNGFQRVCFVIDADPRMENIKPFANVTQCSAFPDEKEVLFMIGSIFQLGKIDYDQSGILIIRMKLYSLNDRDFKELYQHMQKKGTNGETNLLDFADVLSNMSKWDDAEKYYRRYLKDSSNTQKDVDRCYCGLGSLANKKGDYDSSLKWHYKSLAIKKQVLKPDRSIAESYNNIGNAYEKKQDYANALESYEEALKISQQTCGEDHLYVATCMTNMGNAYSGMKLNQDALKFYQNALSIQKKNLPADHVHLGSSHTNIGNVLADLGHYEQALAHLHLSLEIYRKSRPSQHPSIGSTLSSIGLVYKNTRDYQQALSNLNLSLEIFTKSLPSQHPDIGSTLRNIGLVYKDTRDYRQALSYLERAASIYRHSFPSAHPDIIQIEKDIRYVALKLK